ncbi:transposase [Streptomyces sp. NBC_01635]|uniref:transposase n=1 Tax=Streptomyces sp. NBC_01635 TaxID=2975904 RepID=UPI00386EF9E9
MNSGRAGRAVAAAGEGGPEGWAAGKHPRRRIVDAIFYVVRTGCAWRQLPKDFAPWPTVYWYFTGGVAEYGLHRGEGDQFGIAQAGRNADRRAPRRQVGMLLQHVVGRP